jgi:proteasome accessory factor BC
MAQLDRLERLTDLVLVLLDSPRPLTLDELAHRVPGYPEGHEARRQAFERDKRLLRDDGIPVVTEPVEGPEQFGYRIDAEALYLPDLRLAPDEQAALALAVAGVHLGDPSGRDALLKLGASGASDVRPVASLVPPPALVALFDALRVNAAVTFSYRGERRSVAPARLWFRSGRWYLVAWDHDRQDARTFRVDRIDDTPRAGAPGTAELPDGFDAAHGVADAPWQVGDGDPTPVTVAIDALEAHRVRREVASSAAVEELGDGSILVRLEATSDWALRSWLLGMLDHAVLLEPAEARAAMVAWLDGIRSTPVPDGLAGGGPQTPSAATVTPVPGVTDGRPKDAGARLRRLLAMVAWLARVGEATLTELAQRFDIPEDELVHELELASCCGVPPYTPDTLLEILVEDGKVQALLPAGMAQPRRLTPAEGFALSASARTILAVPGADPSGALARGLAKLDAALGGRDGLVVDLDEPPSLLGALRQATRDQTRLEIEYYSASSDQRSVRTVDPRRVVLLGGHWYLDAFCLRAGDVRRFRVDRIGSMRAVGEASGSPDELDPLGTDAFIPGPGATTVRIALDAQGSWVADSVPVLATRALPAGGIEIELAVGGSAWLERLLLQVGPHAWVLDPVEWRDLGAQAAARVLERYSL